MTDGEAAFYPLTRKGEIISESNPIVFKIEILESKSDGKFTSKKIDPTSLKSNQTPALNPNTPVTYTGTVTGDATFEITIIPSRDEFAITGKITDKGRLTNPLNIAVNVGFRPYVKNPLRTDSEAKLFEQRIKRDKFVATVASGNRKQYDFGIGANLHEDMPDGAESLSMKSDGYDFTEFQVAVGGTSKIMFEDEKKLVANGVDFRWIIPAEANPASDMLKITAR